MHDQMTKSEQVKWVFAETGRQIAAIFPATWEFLVDSVNAPFQLVHEIEFKLAVRKIRNEQIRNRLENLTDETLLDRMLKQPVHIPVIANDDPVSIPVRFKIRRLSIDGILAR